MEKLNEDIRWHEDEESLKSYYGGLIFEQRQKINELVDVFNAMATGQRQSCVDKSLHTILESRWAYLRGEYVTTEELLEEIARRRTTGQRQSCVDTNEERTVDTEP